MYTCGGLVSLHLIDRKTLSRGNGRCLTKAKQSNEPHKYCNNAAAAAAVVSFASLRRTLPLLLLYFLCKRPAAT